MVEPLVLVAFVATTAILVLTPGPDMLFIVAVGARGGAGVGFMAALGVAAGLAVHAAAVAFGLAAIFEAVPVAYDVVRLVGAAYLLYLGVRTLRSRGSDLATGSAGPRTGLRRAFTRGMLTNLLNPKVVLFNAAFLPQFVDPSRGSVTAQMLVLGLCFVIVDLLIDGPIGLAAGRIGGFLAGRAALRRRLDVATGSLFVGLSARLALDAR
jgi:threonine/homoserine/homoserine lactone efflux protein